jgi:hypothetical protein
MSVAPFSASGHDELSFYILSRQKTAQNEIGFAEDIGNHPDTGINQTFPQRARYCTAYQYRHTELI